MRKQFTAEENYDRFTAIMNEMNEGAEIEVWGKTGIVVKPSFIGFSSITMRQLSKEFGNFFLQPEGLVLDGVNPGNWHK